MFVGSNSAERKQRQKEHLFKEQGGKCYFCEKEVVFFVMVRRQRPPANGAVLEHLDSRYNPERGQRPYERRVVLSCISCSIARHKVEEESIPVTERRIRSQHDTTVGANVQSLKEFLTEFRVGQTALVYGKYWYAKTLPMDYRDFNKHILEPGSEVLKGKHSYPEGATIIRINNYKWMCAILPYEYHILPIQHIVLTVWRDLKEDECDFYMDTFDG